MIWGKFFHPSSLSSFVFLKKKKKGRDIGSGLLPALILEDSKVLIHSPHLGLHDVAHKWVTESRVEVGQDWV